MRAKKVVGVTGRLGMVLALCLGSVACLRAVEGNTSDATAAILQQPRFREGLIWIGDREPSEVESTQLLQVLNNLDQPSWLAEVEQFLQHHPHSPWAASLHHAYASFCRRTGRTSKALRHWEAAWALVKEDKSEPGKRVGGAVLAGWTDLLSSLGRLEQLRAIVPEGDRWPFVNRQDRERFQGAKDSFYIMQIHPGVAYRCGTLALKAVGQALQPTNRALESLVGVASPNNGFSVAALAEMADQQGLNLRAVRRARGQELIVPSVVHWRQNHYAAILDYQDGSYLVSDPTFGEPKFIASEVINEEASGVFLVPDATQKPGWIELGKAEADRVHGQGLPNTIRDGQDKGCRRNFAGNIECPPCKGTPVWWVSEPWINAFLADEPMSYLTSRGEAFTFRLTYKQRDTRPGGYVGFAGWNHTWNSFARVVSAAIAQQTGPTMPNPAGAFDTTVYLPDGGEAFYPANQKYDQETRTQLMRTGLVFSENANDDGNNGLRVVHADGSQDIYGDGKALWTLQGDHPKADFWLTRRIDPHGNTTTFHYEFAGSTNALFRLKYVVDHDGRTNTLQYVPGDFLSSVTSPYGETATFVYDQNNDLTNITDVAGLSSTLKYDTNGYPIALITPYGTNQIEYTITSTNDTGSNNFGGHVINRAVRVTEPTGGTHLYLYRYESLFMPTNYAASQVPTNTPLNTLDDGSGGTNDLSAVKFRNSFYWNPRQYASLSTTNLNSLTTNDYLRARLRHWLQDTNDLYLSGLVSVERAPSPDGTTEGLKVFYDYEGKIYRHRMGTNSLPSVRAWRQPDGSTSYEWLRFNGFGFITNQVSTYTKPDGSTGARTNQFEYAQNNYTHAVTNLNNGQWLVTTFAVPNLLTRVSEADGNPAWIFGYDFVSWTNYFPTPPSHTNRLVVRSTRIVPRYLTNAVNEVTELAFTGFNKLAGINRPSGLSTTNLYDANGFLWRTVDLEIGRTNSFSYTTNGLIATHTNELGLVVSATWDDLLRLTSAAFPDGTYTSNRYNRLDLSATRDRLGHWSYFGHNGLRQLTAFTNANNVVTRLGWCGCGTLEAVTNAWNTAAQLVTTFGYDLQGNRTHINYPDATTTNWYDSLGRVTTTANGQGYRAFLYNNQGLVTNIYNALGTEQVLVYDILDRPISLTDANGVTVTSTFDLLNRLRTRTYPDGGVEKFGYSARGLTAYTNQLNQPTYFGYDEAGRTIAITNANGEIIRYTNNAAGDLLSLTDGKNQTTRWNFDEYGRLTNKLDQAGVEIFRYKYDPNSRLTNRWSSEKGDTKYSYDLVGNLTNINYPASTDVTFQFDWLNRLTNMTDAAGTTKFTYASGGQLLTEDGPYSNDTITNGYLNRLRTSLILQQPTGTWTNGFRYDAAWRLTNVTSKAGSFDYLYSYASPLPLKVSLPNTSYITNTYDTVARLLGTWLKKSDQTTLNSHQYGYNPENQRTQQVFNVGSTYNYTYDQVGQLKIADSGTASEDRGYTYDTAWNLNYRTNNGVLGTFQVDAKNQLTNAPSLIGGGMTYDSNGNMVTTFYGDTTYTYDDENRLTRVTHPGSGGEFLLLEEQEGWRTDFVYDGLSRLRKRVEWIWDFVGEKWETDSTVIYLYDRNRVIQERDFNGGPLVSYTRGNDLSGSLEGAGGIGGLLARSHGYSSGNWTAHNFYHADGGGNITYLVNSGQTVAASYRYDPYGNLISSSGSFADANVYRFSSKEIHTTSGMYYYGFRFYEPNLQRWLNRDPIGEWGGMNLYGFVGNSPLNHVDPYGFSWYGDLFDYIGEKELAIADAIKEFFLGPPEGVQLKDPDTLRAGSGLIEPLRDQYGNDITRETVAEVALTPLLSVLGGPEREGATIFGNAVKCKKLAKAAEETAAAAKGGGQTFEILDGVRRSKAGDLVGNQTIPAQILNAEGKVVGTQNIPINQLLSPKPSIDVSTTVNMNRFMDTLNKTKAGSVPPPITVTPGGRGVPIRDVPLDPLGPN